MTQSGWTIYICNDNCPDYTWGWDETATRRAFADIVRGHLDEMNRTDALAGENRDHYTMAVTQEALCFVERYPERRDEFIRRIRQGRILVSPFLNNSLWAFQSPEAFIRTLYPARRLEREWGIPVDMADHIEEPSLPWGVATLLAGCGVRWLQVAFLKYDSTFEHLTADPIFVHEGPDGSQVRVAMDVWASLRGAYTQGRKILEEGPAEWIAHYAAIGSTYPLPAILASGTHGDIRPWSGQEAAGFAGQIVARNAEPGDHPRYVNSTIRQFAQAVDSAQASTPFLPVYRGCFGHSWDVWPVSIARIAADAREAERQYLRAEALAAIASLGRPGIDRATRALRERAEWHWAMLGDHAWNGTHEVNKRHNVELRRRWHSEFASAAEDLTAAAWQALGLRPDTARIALFNGLSAPRRDLVRVELPAAAPASAAIACDGRLLPAQVVEERNRTRALYFVSPELAGHGLRTVEVAPTGKLAAAAPLTAGDGFLDGPFYRVEIDPATGGVARLVHKATGAQVAAPGHPLCQTVYFDGQEHVLSGPAIEAVASGPVLARLRIAGKVADISVTETVTIYAELDRVDFDVAIEKPLVSVEERLCHLFPVAGGDPAVRLETTGAVIRPQFQPEGDLLPGADTRRFAIQGFVEATPADGGPALLVAPLDAFLLRRDLGPVVFEAIGNDQNYREVIRDQGGDTGFRFRYAVQVRPASGDLAAVTAWSRSAASPVLAAWGALDENAAAWTGSAPGAAQTPGTAVATVDPARALALSLKPADEADGALILRLQETAGQIGPLAIPIGPFRRVYETDLLERNLREAPVVGGAVTVELRPHGYTALRLVP